MRRGRERLRVEESRLCFREPALVLRDGVFEPLWRGAERAGGGWYCVPMPPDGSIIRVGRGWGRRGGDAYYLVSGGVPRRLARRAVKAIGTREWVTCVYDSGVLVACFAWRDGRLVAVPHPNS